MIQMVLLGTGNVASFLFQAFENSDKAEVVQVYNHSEESLRKFDTKVETTTSLENLAQADLYLIALKDDVIPTVAAKLKDKEGLVVHTSGAVPMAALKACERQGVFYPLQTFSKNKEVQNKEIPFCLEASSLQDLDLLKELAESISAAGFEVSSEQRKKLHLAAVFVCNFVNHLYAIGENICKENDLPFDILRPLIQETADKINSSSPSDVQTGPAIRKDRSTIEAHLNLINSKETKVIYQLLTQSIEQQYGKKL